MAGVSWTATSTLGCHIEFVRAYLVIVLPYLKKSIKSIRDVHPEALTTLQNYFKAVDASIQRLQMQHLVADFQTAVQVITLRCSCGQCIALHCLIIGWVQYFRLPTSDIDKLRLIWMNNQSLNIQCTLVFDPGQQVACRSSAHRQYKRCMPSAYPVHDLCLCQLRHDTAAPCKSVAP